MDERLREWKQSRLKALLVVVGIFIVLFLGLLPMRHALAPQRVKPARRGG